jgi:GWxTD domain-containing protein
MLETIAGRSPGDAEARYRLGGLYLARFAGGRDTLWNRTRALNRLEEAVRLRPDTAKYWLALAEVPQHRKSLPVPIPSSVSRAPKAADQADAWHSLAMLALRAGWGDWVVYSSARNARYRRQDALPALQNPVGPADWKLVQTFMDDAIPDAHGAPFLANAEAEVRAAVDIEPLNIDAVGLLTVLQGAAGRWDDAAGVTRALLRAAPDSGRAWAIRGLVLARAGRWGEAEAAFDTAFARMTLTQRAPFRDLGPVMGWEEEEHFDGTNAAGRELLDARYWRLAQPLAVTGANEARTEFYARVVYAQHAFGDPRRGLSGLGADAGIIYVRYGPPDFEANGVWIYTHPRLVFHLWSRNGRTSYTAFGSEDYRVARMHFPATFENVPIVGTLDTVLVQVVRFRGPRDSLALMVVGAIPLQRMADSVEIRDLPLVSGMLVTDHADREITRDRMQEVVTGVSARELQYRTWRLTMQPGSYRLRVEGALPTIERGARALESLDLAPLSGSGLELSDLLVARRVTPRDSTAHRWSEFLIEPSAGRFAQGQPVDLLWEIYGLTPDSTGTTRCFVEVRVTVQAIVRHHWLLRILGSLGDMTGLSAVGEDQVTIRYPREEHATADHRRTEYLTLDLLGAVEGRYLLEVVVRDRVTGEQGSATRVIAVGPGPIPQTPLWQRR